ncbi:MAG: LacI family DNA-binding transcriptional regulator [Gammaproteobacteria bacterium]|nr:LacI family DNA-binding transcriptional regulator [Gammaproteobacteria bacterium]
MVKSNNSTISDVARLAGVSKKTVSRVINNSPKVGAATRKNVLKVIENLNYVPSPQARGLASRRSYLLGLIYDNPDPLYIDAIQRGILSVCGPAGYELVVHPCELSSHDYVADILRFIARSHVDGVIILPPVSEHDEVSKAIHDAGSHYVRLAAAAIDDNRRIVVSNERAAVRELTEYLIQLGHKRIGFISGPHNYLSTRERFGGFLEGCQKYEIAFDKKLKIEGNYSFESGESCTRKLLSLDNAPTAIFASNDDMAAGAMHAACKLGIDIPGSLSVAGFDDSRLASLILPTLTTIKRPVTHMSSLAAVKLIAAIDHGKDTDSPTDMVVVPEVIIRNSTGACSGFQPTAAPELSAHLV